MSKGSPIIHKYSLNGYNIVLDTNSGAVHILDDIAFILLDYIDVNMDDTPSQYIIDELSDKYNETEILSAYNDLYELYKNELLFSKDDYGQYAKKAGLSPIKAMCLHVAHDCNLRCEYCFAAKGDFGQGRKLMPYEVGKKAIDFLIEKSENRRNLELDFFGGEPLMNMKVVKQIVSYAREQEKLYNKNFRFTITTNGLMLNDDNINFINREMSNVVLSIDGRKEINDKMRVKVDGSGSYDSIIAKYRQLVEDRGFDNYYVRGTFTRYNYDFAKDVKHLYEQGFSQISIEPVVSDTNLSYAITESDLPKVFEEYEKLAKWLIEIKKCNEEINFFHFMIDLDQGPCAIKRLRGCGCGNEYVAVVPEGDIYPCHQFVGMDDMKMGNLLDNSLDTDMKDNFSKTSVYDKPECYKCWAKFYCSGGCNANNKQYCGSILNPHKLSCELEKKRLECALMIKAALA